MEELPSSTHVVQASCKYRLAVIGSPLSLQGTYSYPWSRDYSLSSSWLPELAQYSDFSPNCSSSTSSPVTSWSWQMFLQSLFYSINRTLFERPKEIPVLFLESCWVRLRWIMWEDLNSKNEGMIFLMAPQLVDPSYLPESAVA